MVAQGSKIHPTIGADTETGVSIAEKAANALSAYCDLVPDRTISSWKAMNDYDGSEGGKRYFDGLRKAGLPE